MHTHRTVRTAATAATWLVAFVLPLLCIANVAQAIDRFDKISAEISRVFTDAARLTNEQVAELEQNIENNPHDVQARTKLLGYYFLKQSSDKSLCQVREEHILWLIKHDPEAPVLGNPIGILNPKTSLSLRKKAAKLWDKHIKADRNNLRLLFNAARASMHTNRSRSIELLERASAIEPNNGRWHQRIGRMRVREAKRNNGTVKKQGAVHALAAYEKAFEKITDPVWRQKLRSDIAETAVYAEQYDKAVRYARDLLQVAAEAQRPMSAGQAIYDGNMVLARVAFAKDDLEEAGRLLVRAGKTSGSPPLKSFGPSMSLARDLLKAGRTEPVIEYLKQCGRFWYKETTDKWIETIKQGDIPDFGRNLRY